MQSQRAGPQKDRFFRLHEERIFVGVVSPTGTECAPTSGSLVSLDSIRLKPNQPDFNLKLADRTIGTGNPCFLIAEVALAHDGSLGMAHAFIDAAAAVGVDAVKFQTHIAAAESTAREAFRVPVFPQDKSRFDYWRRTEFSLKQWRGLADHARRSGLIFLSSPFSEQAVDWLLQCEVPAWKIASGEVGNLPLLEKIAATRLPVLISSGMSSWAELGSAVKFFRDRQIEVATLQCTSAYPCPPESWGLNFLAEMRTAFHCPVGFSDHSGSGAASLAAVTLGANVIEFHLTFHRGMFGPDVASSLTLEQAQELTRGIRQLEKALASPIDKDRFAGTTTAMRGLFTKSIVAACPIPAGTVLQREHLDFKKPGDGLPPHRYAELLGRVTTRSLAKDELISDEHLRQA